MEKPLARRVEVRVGDGSNYQELKKMRVGASKSRARNRERKYIIAPSRQLIALSSFGLFIDQPFNGLSQTINALSCLFSDFAQTFKFLAFRLNGYVLVILW